MSREDCDYFKNNLNAENVFVILFVILFEILMQIYF
jgi:hypothetical protein